MHLHCVFFTTKNAKERKANGRNFLSSFETHRLLSFLHDAPPLQIFFTAKNAKRGEEQRKEEVPFLGIFIHSDS